jgi:hypothetical protein
MCDRRWKASETAYNDILVPDFDSVGFKGFRCRPREIIPIQVEDTPVAIAPDQTLVLQKLYDTAQVSAFGGKGLYLTGGSFTDKEGSFTIFDESRSPGRIGGPLPRGNFHLTDFRSVWGDKILDKHINHGQRSDCRPIL